MRHNFLIGPMSRSLSVSEWMNEWLYSEYKILEKVGCVSYEPPNVHFRDNSHTEKSWFLSGTRFGTARKAKRIGKSLAYRKQFWITLFWGESCHQNGHLVASSPLHWRSTMDINRPNYKNLFASLYSRLRQTLFLGCIDLQNSGLLRWWLLIRLVSHPLDVWGVGLEWSRIRKDDSWYPLMIIVPYVLFPFVRYRCGSVCGCRNFFERFFRRFSLLSGSCRKFIFLYRFVPFFSFWYWKSKFNANIWLRDGRSQIHFLLISHKKLCLPVRSGFVPGYILRKSKNDPLLFYLSGICLNWCFDILFPSGE